MRGVRSGWTSFRRIHLAALLGDRRRSLLSVVGVAVGVTVVLGTLVLERELTRPFDSYGPSLTHAAGDGVLEIVPNVEGRLPNALVDRLRAEVPGAEAVIPIVAGLTPVRAKGDVHGFFLLGGSCRIERLVGPFDCDRRAAERPAQGPGVPLEMPAPIAARHGLHLGDELKIPGLPAGSAHLGWTFPEFDRVRTVNDGYVLLAPSAEVAARIFSVAGHVTSAFVVPRPGADIGTDVERVIDGLAVATAPRGRQPAVFENAGQSFDLTVLAGILIGFLVAMNTILLAVEDRRAVMGTIGAIGANPAGLLAGMLGEGAVVGVLGGLLAVPSGFLLGAYLVDRFGTSMLAGSGGTIVAHFSANLVVIGAGAGLVSGILAMAGPAIRLARDGPLASMASAGGIQRARRLPLWPAALGIAVIGAAVIVLKNFEHGALPLNVGIDGLTLGLFGVVLLTVCVAPRAALWSIQAFTAARPDIGRLLRADVQRYALLFGISAAILVNGTSLAIGSQTMQLLATSRIAAEKAERLPSAVLIAARSVLDQRDGAISDPVFARIAGSADGRETSSRWRSTISSGASSRIVIGVTPGDRFSRALYQPTTADEGLWAGLRGGEVAVSEVAASRLGVATGQTVELPTVAGPKSYRVAGVFEPRMIDDAVVGDIVLVSDALARSDWAAVRDQVAVFFPTAADAAAHRAAFAEVGEGLSVYDDDGWRVAATRGITRFLEPFTLSGYIVMVAAGLSVLNVFVLGLVQRKRERAALRAIGVTPGQEQAVVVAHAALLASSVAVIGALGGMGLAYLWTLGSPVFYGIGIGWAPLAAPLRTGVTMVIVLVAAAAVYPVVHARRLETVEILRSA